MAGIGGNLTRALEASVASKMTRPKGAEDDKIDPKTGKPFSAAVFKGDPTKFYPNKAVNPVRNMARMALRGKK
jgi:hypothetical protein